MILSPLIASEEVFKAVADPTRQRALMVLLRHELAVSELVEVLGQPQSTVSRHLKVLREAGLIRDRRDGKTVVCSVVERNPDVGAAGGPNGQPLAAQVLDWLSQQAIPNALARRLDRVLVRRREMSRRFFHRMGHRWDSLREESFGKSFHLESLVALLPSEWVVADIGTGTGYMLPTLAPHFRRVIAVEPVGRMLEAARQRVAHYGLENVSLQRGDLNRLPIKNASVDLAIAILVLHHVATPQDALGELSRVVPPGGRTLIVEQVMHGHESFRDRMQDRWWGFEPRRIVTWLQTAGFEAVHARKLQNVERADDAPALFVVTGTKGRSDETHLTEE